MAEVNTTNVEVTEVTNPMDDVVDMMEENPSGGKKLVGLVVAGVAAVAVGAAVLFRKRKNRKEANLQEAENDMDFDEYVDEDDDWEDDLVPKVTEVVAESEKDDQNSEKK